MTKSFEMWYWSEDRFYKELGSHFANIEMYPITDWLPYPHVIYLCENKRDRSVKCPASDGVSSLVK
ncbi:MAG: hypothetical protein R2682_03725 [Pyrinomonadaceae bacterium]